MSSIFKGTKIYPKEDEKLKKHFHEFTDVYIGLAPFYTVENRTDFHSPNKEFPSDKEIETYGKLVQWKEIVENTSIQNYAELNKALMTSIGAYRSQLERQDLLTILNKYTEENSIWHPDEGRFDWFTLKSLFQLLKEYNMERIEVQDEHYQHKKQLDLNNISDVEFAEKIDGQDYYIYSLDENILVTIGWDYFFFFIAIKSNVIDKKKIEQLFEGFWASETDTHHWDWKPGELKQLLKNKNWWTKFIKIFFN